VFRISHPPFAHGDIEPLRQTLGRTAKRRVVGDQKQRASAPHPITDGIRLFVGECGLIGAVVVHVFGAQGVGNHQDLECPERLLSKRLAVRHHLITITKKQLSERFVTPRRSMEIVMRLVEHYTRIVF
jgi:hypothetical protein